MISDVLSDAVAKIQRYLSAEDTYTRDPQLHRKITAISV